MKLVLIITDFGAFNNFLAELSSIIVNKIGYTLHVICADYKVIEIEDKENYKKQNITFHFVDIPRTTNLVGQIKSAIKIRALLKHINPDLIHAHFTTATFSTILFKAKQFPYWSTIHGLGMNSSTGLKKIMFTIVETFCFMRVDRIFVVNTQDFNLVKRHFSRKAKKYDCLGFGCDINKFNPDIFTDDDKQVLKEKLGIKEGVTVISFTGRYVYFKGFNLVIETFKKLTERYPDKFKLVLMGGQDPIHKTGLDITGQHFFSTCKNIINVGFTSDVEKYLSISDIFLFPSKKEGLPTCTLESLAMGVPVVTFNTRGNNDIIKNNYNGILIEPGDMQKEVEYFTDSLIKLAFDENKRNTFKQNALKDRPEYSRNNFINEHLVYYSTVKTI